MNRHKKHSTALFLLLALLHVIVAILLLRYRQDIFPYPTTEGLAELYDTSIRFGITILTVLFFIILGAFLSGPVNPLTVRGNLNRIGFTNSLGNAPYLLRKRINPALAHGFILDFENQGIPITDWLDKRADLEATFNINIIKIVEGCDKRHIRIYAVPAQYGLPAFIQWDNSYLPKNRTELCLGVSIMGPETIDISRIPHMLIGGSTGSGKSVLLKLLLMQCLQKGEAVYIADFKGGVDFPPAWHKRCHMIFDEPKLLATLQELVGEMNTRMEILSRAGCANIKEYNNNIRNTYKRIIVACDEVAELLDKTGRTKEDKELIDKISGCLTSLARLGRAMGIHLVLATQRPDANVIPGQIKNNLDFRICGRADQVLSQIILDKSDANDLIPKDAQGRFLINNGTIFQAFWFDESILEEDILYE